MHRKDAEQRVPSGHCESPQRAECMGDDVYFSHSGVCHESKECLSRTPCHLNMLSAVQRCSKIANTSARKGLINDLPDPLLCEIFRFLLRSRDRASCASVCMRWLLLQSQLQDDEFVAFARHEASEERSDAVSILQDAANGVDDCKRVERQPQWAMGDLSRVLEGKKATDVRLAAIAVGSRARGGLGKLSIRQGSAGQMRGVTNFGLSSIGICCSALRTLSLWDCPNVGDEGLQIIAKGCRLLEKIDLYKCPMVRDFGMQSLAEHCPMISSIIVDSCPLVGGGSLIAISKGCANLLTLSIQNCPLICDDGLVAISRNSKKLRRMKLEGLHIGNEGLISMATNCKALICLEIHSLNMVTREGFLGFAKLFGLQFLKRLSVANCKEFEDDALAAISSNYGALKSFAVAHCKMVTDEGLLVFLQNSTSLEALLVHSCHSISARAIFAAFYGISPNLRKLEVRTCDGIGDESAFPSFCCHNNTSLESLSFTQCRGVGNTLLASLGHHCHAITYLELSGLHCISDDCLQAIFEGKILHVTSVDVSGCSKLTDRAVCAITESSGSTLKNLVLGGCKGVTDKGLKVVATLCVALVDLDVSECSVSNEGVLAVLKAAGKTLSSLNLSGCEGITDEILCFIEINCQGLNDLNVKHCKGLSRSGLDSFKFQLWSCHVVYTK